MVEAISFIFTSVFLVEIALIIVGGRGGRPNLHSGAGPFAQTNDGLSAVVADSVLLGAIGRLPAALNTSMYSC